MAPDGIAPAMAFLGALDAILLVHLDAEARSLRDRDETVGIVDAEAPRSR